MDSFEFNKIIGALLGMVFVAFSVSLVSDAIFAAPNPEKPGFLIEAAEEAPAGGGAKERESVLPLLASADVKAGETVHNKCVACHTVEKGGPNKVGPNLWGVVNRPIASHEGFSYSAGIKEFSQNGSLKWDYDHLDHFLENPKGYVKGTAMGFGGVKKTQERADLIAYLRTLSDNPEPLPDASAAPAAENASAPADGTPAAQPAAGEAAPAPAEGAAPAPAEGAAPAPADGTAPAPAESTAPAPAEGAAPAPAEGAAPAPADGTAPAPADGAAPAPAPAEGTAPAQ